MRAVLARKVRVVPHARSPVLPGPRHPRPQTREQWLQRTENARREARYKHAEVRIRKIADGDPALTNQQRANLAAILAPGDAA